MSEHYCMYKDGMCELDIDEAYQQGRADKYQEIVSEYMLLTEKQVAEIRADAINECIEALGNNIWDIAKLEQLKEQNK